MWKKKIQTLNASDAQSLQITVGHFNPPPPPQTAQHLMYICRSHNRYDIGT